MMGSAYPLLSTAHSVADVNPHVPASVRVLITSILIYLVVQSLLLNEIIDYF